MVERELRYLASRLFSQQLNRDRPLWEFIFVEGLDSIPQVPKGSVALISKVHHCGFDGKSGADLMSMLFDVSPIPRDTKASGSQREERPPWTCWIDGKKRLSLYNAAH